MSLLTILPRRTGSAAFLPTSLSNLAFWVRAGSFSLNDGDPIGTWTDESGNGRDATQATAAKKPLYKVNIVNGLPVARFDGVDDALLTTAFTFNQPSTVYLVSTAATDTGYLADGADALNARVIQRMNNTTIRAYAGTIFDVGTITWGAGFHVIGVVFNGASSVMSFDGVETAGNLGAGAANGLTIGSGGGGGAGFSSADIAEVVAYSAAHDATNRALLKNYLATKYNITVS